jgi:wyosine [tRNA(Phe)-imidazoG37] synthetase (radical SAM superfamily)
MRYIFGPVTSHRLGLSLGLDVVPRKTCNFNCIYCELGPTPRRTGKRAPYVRAAALLAEAEAYLSSHRRRPDVLTVAGSGEPTLNSELGEIITGLKGFGLPVALLTNGSLFVAAGVRREALPADLILPSLDAADDATLARVNRPLPGLSVAAYAEGLRALRREFAGRIYLEVLLACGVNDSPEHLERLAQLCAGISPDRLQLTTVLRPPAESQARPVSGETLALAQAVFAARLGCPVDVPGVKGVAGAPEKAAPEDLEDELLALLSRRPATAVDAARALGAKDSTVSGLLARLVLAGSVEERLHEGRPFYHARRRA